MKRLALLAGLALVLIAATAWGAETFLGLPLMTGGQEIQKTEKRLVMEYKAKPEQIIEYYQNILKDANDVKIRQFHGRRQFEDYSILPWNKIVITQNQAGASTVTITKDSWTWILGMLVIRYTGVFVVVICLFLGIKVGTYVIHRTVPK